MCGVCMNMKPGRSEASARGGVSSSKGRPRSLWVNDLGSGLVVPYRLHSSSLLGLPYRILNTKHKKELLSTMKPLPKPFCA